MKKLLLLPAVLVSVAASAQKPAGTAKTVNCAAVQTENEALKEKIVAYEARLGIGVGGVVVTDGNPTMKIKFISCKANKSTHRAVLTYQVTNSGEPQTLEILTLRTQDNPTMVVDEQGKTYFDSSDYYPSIAGRLTSIVPSNVPVNGTITFLDVPLTTTRLNTAVLSFIVGMKRQDYFKTSIKNIPIAWLP